MYRTLRSHILKQLPVLLKLGFRVLLPIVVLYALVALQPFVSFSVLLRDATSATHNLTGEVRFYFGAFSNLGILLWWANASVCAFAASIVSRRGSRDSVRKGLLAYLAAFTGLLALDDMFMIHKEILPAVLGVPEVVMYAFYGVLSAGLVRFARALLKTDFLILVLAFSFFAVSMLADQMGGPNLTGIGLLIEDLSKMLGIVCWLFFAVRTSRYFLIRHVG